MRWLDISFLIWLMIVDVRNTSSKPLTWLLSTTLRKMLFQIVPARSQTPMFQGASNGALRSSTPCCTMVFRKCPANSLPRSTDTA